MSARARNWRLEAVAWLAAIALIVGALAFSGASDDAEQQAPADPAPAPTAPVVQP